MVSVQKMFLSIFAPQLLHKRLKESPENTPLAKPQMYANVAAATPQLVVSNDLINNANKMEVQVGPVIPAVNTSSES